MPMQAARLAALLAWSLFSRGDGLEMECQASIPDGACQEAQVEMTEDAGVTAMRMEMLQFGPAQLKAAAPSSSGQPTSAADDDLKGLLSAHKRYGNDDEEKPATPEDSYLMAHRRYGNDEALKDYAKQMKDIATNDPTAFWQLVKDKVHEALKRDPARFKMAMQEWKKQDPDGFEKMAKAYRKHTADLALPEMEMPNKGVPTETPDGLDKRKLERDNLPDEAFMRFLYKMDPKDYYIWVKNAISIAEKKDPEEFKKLMLTWAKMDPKGFAAEMAEYNTVMDDGKR